MNICHIILTNNFAGSEKYCADLANYQVSLKNYVMLILLKQKKDTVNIIKNLDKEIHIEEISFVLQGYQIKQIIKKNKFDIIHAHLGNASKLIKNIKIPRISTLHIDYRKKQHCHLDGLICINENQLENSKSFSGSKKLIYNWIPQIPKYNTDTTNVLREKILARSDKYIFGYFGRFNKSKNVPLLIEAFKLANLPNSKLILIGDGEEKEYLKKISKKNSHNIIFIETQSNIYPYFELIDCFVLPSIFEPFGLVILEAMYFNKKIISTNLPISKFLPKNSVLLSFSVNEMSALMKKFYKNVNEKVNYDLSPFNRIYQISKIMHFYSKVIKEY